MELTEHKLIFTSKDLETDQEVEMVPGLWRLCYPEKRTESTARFRSTKTRICLHLRHRLLIALSVLHGHVWHALYPMAEQPL